ncbi:Uncharacterised protein [BD1-7 clade bacterium]|uniref:Uncharacterized protein n=1 Tax=BD1-7 clade bacterium TaxID=2029982 RepID=A0A5S9P642_9GAMM|nr:Uncharacterised protein [BD1-7 clade bacterium]
MNNTTTQLQKATAQPTNKKHWHPPKITELEHCRTHGAKDNDPAETTFVSTAGPS